MAGDAAGQHHGDGLAAQQADHFGHVDAAAAGVDAFIDRARFVAGADAVHLRRHIDGRVQRQGHDRMGHRRIFKLLGNFGCSACALAGPG
jgi:hypothetical protein